MKAARYAQELKNFELHGKIRKLREIRQKIEARTFFFCSSTSNRMEKYGNSDKSDNRLGRGPFFLLINFESHGKIRKVIQLRIRWNGERRNCLASRIYPGYSISMSKNKKGPRLTGRKTGSAPPRKL